METQAANPARFAPAVAAAPQTDAPATIMANRPPAITWHRLKMNDVRIDLPAVVDPGAHAVDAEVRGDAVLTDSALDSSDAADAFNHALAHAGGVDTWETGMGPEAAAWLSAAAARHLAIAVPEGATGALTVRITAVDGACAIAAIDVIARPHTHVQVAVLVDSPQAGAGVTGSYVRILAEAGAHVELAQQQTLDDSWTHLEDVGVFAADDARVDVEQTVLGAAASYSGFAADLAGYRAACDVDTRYLGHGAQKLDFNYIMRQRGGKTRGKLIAGGVLTDTSEKVLRGTIDLIHGAKGAVGREQETVLLANQKVRNKTIPVILCDEDDVQGDHGATIGHVNPEQLEYMRSRGLTVAQIEALFATASFDYAAARAVDAQAHASVDRLARTVLGHGLEDEDEDDASRAVGETPSAQTKGAQR